MAQSDSFGTPDSPKPLPVEAVVTDWVLSRPPSNGDRDANEISMPPFARMGPHEAVSAERSR